MNKPLSSELLNKMNAYWRAANYLSVGQIYLFDNPLLKKPLKIAHVKPRLLGHWGTTPGLNFVYVHLNRVIKQYDLNMLYVTGLEPDQAERAPAPDTAGRAWWLTRIWRALIANFIPISRRTNRV